MCNPPVEKNKKQYKIILKAQNNTNVINAICIMGYIWSL